jgi:putative lipoprotein
VRNKRLRAAAGAAGLVLVAGAAAAQTISGTATYATRMALPKNAVFEATLLDVSRMDAPADELGRTRIESPGNPPIAFSITYDPTRVVDTRSYVVRATIRTADRLWFTTDQAYPVLTRGHGTEVALTLRAVSNPMPPQVKPPDSDVSIEKTYWRLARLGEDEVKFRAGEREPHLVFEAGGRVSGADGCNTLRGLYELSGRTIKIGPLVGTLMACAEAKGLDARFREAVGSATSINASETTLDLIDGTGTVIARFNARPD